MIHVKSYAASANQAGMWLEYKILPHSVAYHCAFTCRIEGLSDVAAFERAAQALIQRHDMLRTRFEEEEDWPQAVVLETWPLPIRHHQCSEANLDDFVQRAYDAPFQLERDIPYCFHLFHYQPDRCVFLFLCHHILGDAWAIALLINDFMTLLGAEVSGQTVTLPPHQVFYEMFADDQRIYMRSPGYQQSMRFWRKMLEGELPVLEFPTDFERPRFRTDHGEALLIPLEENLLHRLRSRAQELKTTLANVLFTSYGLLLSYQAQQRDIVIGMPTAGREAKFHEVVGDFINPVPVRMRLQGNPRLSEITAQMGDMIMALRPHSQVPLQELLKRFGKTSTDRPPLFQAMFNIAPLRNFKKLASLCSPLPWSSEQQAVQIEGLKLTGYPFTQQLGQFELTLDVMEMGRSLVVLEFKYNADLYKKTSMVLASERLIRLLEVFAAGEDPLLSDIVWMDEAEQRQVLLSWNQTQASLPVKNLLAQIESHVLEQPTAIALCFQGKELTYQDVWAQSGTLAQALIAQGVVRDSLVGLCADRGFGMVLGAIAIHRAGGAYVPLDPDYPADRLRYIVADAGCRLIVCNQSRKDLAESLGGAPFLLDEPRAEAVPPVRTLLPQQMAYAIFTSGSTGQPKGVCISHHNLLNLLTGLATDFAFQASDRLLAVTSLSFDIAGLELFMPLLKGARLHIADAATARNGKALRELLIQDQITYLQATPSTWRMLIEAGMPENLHLTQLCGGEALPPELVSPLLQGGRRLWNVYGPTETTIWSTRSLLREKSALTIGWPMQNTQIYILDRFLKPLPVGVPGDLYIGGYGLARGYAGKPARTAAVFVPNPFSQEPGARLYLTGDLARYLADGQVEYLGRTDFQLKIRGFRVETGDIEAALIQHPQIREAVVVARKEPSGLQLVAWMIAEPSVDPFTINPREHLGKLLPDYMIPAHFGWRKEYPRTLNNKLDRGALSAEQPPRVATAASRSWTNTEARLVALWEEILGLQMLDVDDNFFNLGGHSLLAIRLCNRIEEEMGVRFDLPVLFRHSTPALLAQEVERGAQPASPRAAIALKRGGSRPPLFCICGLFLYRELALNLPEDLPVYAVFIQSEVDALQGNSQRLPSLEEMATGYLEEVRRVQPKGPYRLAGISFGGLISFEVARQLALLGEEVSFLGLLDTILPSSTSKNRLYWMGYQMKRVFTSGPGFAVKKLATLLGARRNLPTAGGAGAPNLADEVVVRGFRGEIYSHASRGYVPQKTQTKLHLFRAMELDLPEYMEVEESRGWAGLSDHLKIIDIPGDHLAMLHPPYVKNLSEHLTRILGDLDQK